MDKDIIRAELLSDKNINHISTTGYWIKNHHSGSKVIEYFLDEGLDYEYANTSIRKKIIKEYLSLKIEEIFDDLSNGLPEKLYRSIYLKDKPSNSGFFGLFWSSRYSTSPCVEKADNEKEYLLSIEFNPDEIDWLETVRSRLDYLFGDKEEEFQMISQVKVELLNIEEIKAA